MSGVSHMALLAGAGAGAAAPLPSFIAGSSITQAGTTGTTTRSASATLGHATKPSLGLIFVAGNDTGGLSCSGVTVDGVAATPVREAGTANQIAAIWQIALAAGSTTRTVAVTISDGSPQSFGFATATLIDLSSTTATVADFSADASSTSGSVTTSAGGIVVANVMQPGNNFPFFGAWTGLTEMTDFATMTGRSLAVAYAEEVTAGTFNASVAQNDSLPTYGSIATWR